MASREEVSEFLTGVLRDVINLDVDDDVDPGSELGPDGIGLESIGLMELVVHIEQQYGLTISDETFESLLGGTFSGLVDEIVLTGAPT